MGRGYQKEQTKNILVVPLSLSKMRKPSSISAVLGTNSFDVIFCGSHSLGIFRDGAGAATNGRWTRPVADASAWLTKRIWSPSSISLLNGSVESYKTEAEYQMTFCRSVYTTSNKYARTPLLAVWNLDCRKQELLESAPKHNLRVLPKIDMAGSESVLSWTLWPNKKERKTQMS